MSFDPGYSTTLLLLKTCAFLMWLCLPQQLQKHKLLILWMSMLFLSCCPNRASLSMPCWYLGPAPFSPLYRVTPSTYAPTFLVVVCLLFCFFSTRLAKLFFFFPLLMIVFSSDCWKSVSPPGQKTGGLFPGEIEPERLWSLDIDSRGWEWLPNKSRET